jgi:hypothetical protein
MRPDSAIVPRALLPLRVPSVSWRQSVCSWGTTETFSALSRFVLRPFRNIVRHPRFLLHNYVSAPPHQASIEMSTMRPISDWIAYRAELGDAPAQMRARLIAAGWHVASIDRALEGTDRRPLQEQDGTRPGPDLHLHPSELDLADGTAPVLLTCHLPRLVVPLRAKLP